MKPQYIEFAKGERKVLVSAASKEEMLFYLYNGWEISDVRYSYQYTFNAIAAATSSTNGNHVVVSVKAFYEELTK